MISKWIINFILQTPVGASSNIQMLSTYLVDKLYILKEHPNFFFQHTQMCLFINI